MREEMDRAGAIELLMPTIQPQGTVGRNRPLGKIRRPAAEDQGPQGGQEFCYGPTAEEVITDFARNELASYKQLPVNFYQIQTKFRDEIRPRFGVMRAREFLMKDAYSFHLRRRLAGTPNTATCTRLQPHLHPPGPGFPRGAGRYRRDRRRRLARIPRAGRLGRGRARLLRRLGLRRQHGTGRGGRARRTPCGQRSPAQGRNADPEDLRRRRRADGHRAWRAR